MSILVFSELFVDNYYVFPQLVELYLILQMWSTNILFNAFFPHFYFGQLQYVKYHRFQCWLYHSSFQQEVAALLTDIVFGGWYASTRHWGAFGYYQQEFIWNGICA
eukprot:477329_1